MPYGLRGGIVAEEPWKRGRKLPPSTVFAREEEACRKAFLKRWLVAHAEWGFNEESAETYVEKYWSAETYW